MGSDLGDTEIIGPRCIPVDTIPEGGKERLCVDASVSVTTSGAVPTVSNKFVYEDMNATTGGVARGTSINTTATTLYSYSGTGLFMGARIHVQSLADWRFNFLVDGSDIMNDMLMSDLLGTPLYGFGPLDDEWVGLRRRDNILEFMAPDDFPIRFGTDVVIKGRVTGVNKNFLAGLVAIEKFT